MITEGKDYYDENTDIEVSIIYEGELAEAAEDLSAPNSTAITLAI